MTDTHFSRWWYGWYVDERNSCFKKVYVEEFHNHLNSVHQNIQFIQEVKEESRLFSGLQSHQGVWRDTREFIKKTTHTNRLTSTLTPITQPSTKDHLWIHSVIGLDKYHRQKQSDPDRGNCSLWLIKNCKSYFSRRF